jgi:hypothetical protein
VGDRPAGGGRSAPETSAHRPGATAGAAHAAAPTAFQSASPAASLGAAQAPARARQLPAGRSEPETGRCASGRLGRGSLPADRPARAPAAVRTIGARASASSMAQPMRPRSIRMHAPRLYRSGIQAMRHRSIGLEDRWMGRNDRVRRSIPGVLVSLERTPAVSRAAALDRPGQASSRPTRRRPPHEPLCVVCRQPIKPNESLVLSGSATYHIRCFNRSAEAVDGPDRLSHGASRPP